MSVPGVAISIPLEIQFQIFYESIKNICWRRISRHRFSGLRPAESNWTLNREIDFSYN
jgi:hypothetical protein